MNVLVKIVRFALALVVAAVVAFALSAASSQLFTLAYRAYNHLPGDAKLIDNPEWVAWNLIIAFPVLVVAFLFIRKRVWRWSARFDRAKLESDPA